MNIFAIDTSTDRLSLAISINDQIVKQKNCQTNNRLSSILIREIDKLFKSINKDISELDCIVVGLGPGSFTGLRVGLSAVKALSLVSKVPVTGIPSHDAIALANKNIGNIAVITDARRDLIYSCIYEKQKTLKTISTYQLCTLKEFLKQIKKTTNVTGDAVAIYREQLMSHQKILLDAETKSIRPQAKYLIEAAREKIQKLRYDDINKLVPLYLYEENCQVVNAKK